MSKPQPPRFGELPPGDTGRVPAASPGHGGHEGRRGPLPLMTQPMAAAQPSGRLLPTDLLSTRVGPDPSAGPGGGAMTIRPDEGLPSAPPEIGLTQHHLPEEAPDPRLVLVHSPDSERAANFRVLRHHLLEAGRPQVIVVSSPRPGEGKTTTAVNLALALAECDRAKVLLVECHLRHPQLATMLRHNPSWCFAEQLAAHRHQPMLPWSFVDIPQLWLHVAALSPRVSQRQILDAPSFAIAMERLRLAGYDHIVVDAPPVLGSADVNLMQDAADGVVLTLRARQSTARDLRRAFEQLSPGRVLGTVLLQ